MVKATARSSAVLAMHALCIGVFGPAHFRRRDARSPVAADLEPRFAKKVCCPCSPTLTLTWTPTMAAEILLASDSPGRAAEGSESSDSCQEHWQPMLRTTCPPWPAGCS